MAKRRAVPRSTMTLKDFHGGSIPSDLSLPSAPGKTVERSPYERQSSGAWAIPSSGRGYALDRSGIHRQGSSTGIRSFEDKASYFPNTANIGRNYDEDERKPVEGRSCRNHSAEPCDMHDYDELKSPYSGEEKVGFNNHSMFSGRGTSDYDNIGKIHDPSMAPFKPSVDDSRRQLNVPQSSLSVPQSPEAVFYGQPQNAFSPSSGRRLGNQQLPASPQGWGSSSNQQQQAAVKVRGASESVTVNVWTARREGEHTRNTSAESDAPRPPSQWMPLNNRARVAEASAIEKVSSGRWQPDYTRIPSPIIVDNGTSDQTHDCQISPQPGFSPDSSSPYYAATAPDALSSQQTAGSRSDRGSEIYRERLRDPLYDASLHYSDNIKSLALVGRDNSCPDVSRISLNEREQGSYINWSHANYLESDRHIFPSHRRLTDSVQTRSAGYSETGSGSYQGADGSQHRSSSQVQDEKEYGLEFVQRSSSRDLDISSSLGQGRTADVTQKVHDSGVPTRGMSSVVNKYFSEGSVIQNFQERSGRADFLAQIQKPFPSERSSNSCLGDSLTGSYEEVPHGRCSPTSGQSSLSPERELKSSFSKSDDRLFFLVNDVASTISEPIPSPTAISDQSRLLSGERPRLKLLPRTKPLEQASENTSNSPRKSGLQEGLSNDNQLDGRKPVVDLKSSRSLVTRSTQENGLNSIATPPLIENDEHTEKTVDRPKLNLKPRSRPAESHVEPDSNDRSSVFGGARPRELVLKERGVEDPVVAEANITGNRVKQGRSEQQNIAQIESKDKLAIDEKQASRQTDRQGDRSFKSRHLERQDSSHLEWQDSGKDQRESKWSSARNINQGHPDQQVKRRDQSCRIPDKQDVTRDIDKQDSWRRSSGQPTTAGLQSELKDNYITNREKQFAGLGVKYGSYGIASADPKRLAALTQSKLAFGPHGVDYSPDYENYPGKRGLPS